MFGDGTAYKSREGDGKAFILKGGNSTPYLISAMGRIKANKKAKENIEGADTKRNNEFLSKLGQTNPEFWYMHDSNKQKAMDELFDLGSKITGEGADPFTGVDEASQLFQRKKNRLEKMSAYSVQVKDASDKTIAEINKNPDKYTDESKIAFSMYREMPLDQLVDGNVQPPMLVHKSPDKDMLKRDVDLAKGLKSSKPDGYTDDDISMIAARDLSQPDVRHMIQSTLSAMSPGQIKNFKNLADNANMTVPQFIRTQQLRPHLAKPSDDYDFDEVESMLNPGLTENVYENKDGVTSTKVGLDRGKTHDYVVAMTKFDRTYYSKALQKGRWGMNPVYSPEKNQELMYDGLTDKLIAEAKSTTKLQRDQSNPNYNYFGSGYGKKEVMDNRDKWYSRLKKGDNGAAQYLRGMSMKDGTSIRDAFVHSDNNGGRWLVVKSVNPTASFSTKEGDDAPKEQQIKVTSFAVSGRDGQFDQRPGEDGIGAFTLDKTPYAVMQEGDASHPGFEPSQLSGSNDDGGDAINMFMEMYDMRFKNTKKMFLYEEDKGPYTHGFGNKKEVKFKVGR